jgi:hypothetical protein
MRGGWVVPAAAAVAAVTGSFLAISVSLAISPSGQVGAVSNPPGLDLRLVALLFAAPAAALVAAAVSYRACLAERPRLGAMLGVVAGILVGAGVGARSAAIGTWWLASLPSDSNQSAGFLTALLTLVIGFAVAFSVAAVSDEAIASQRGRLAALASIGALTGFFAGAGIGGITGALTFAVHACPPANYLCSANQNPFSAMEAGALTGSWIGGGMGLVSGLFVWPFRHRP